MHQGALPSLFVPAVQCVGRLTQEVADLQQQLAAAGAEAEAAASTAAAADSELQGLQLELRRVRGEAAQQQEASSAKARAAAEQVAELQALMQSKNRWVVCWLGLAGCLWPPRGHLLLPGALQEGDCTGQAACWRAGGGSHPCAIAVCSQMNQQ
jgi:hypothetical protein